MEKIFKLQKLKREPCKSKKCKNIKEKKGKKMKKKLKLKRELQKKNKKTSNGPRFRSAKKGIMWNIMQVDAYNIDIDVLIIILCTRIHIQEKRS